MKRAVLLLFAGCLLVFLFGCDNGEAGGAAVDSPAVSAEEPQVQPEMGDAESGPDEVPGKILSYEDFGWGDAMEKAARDKEEIMAAIQGVIQQYRSGGIPNDELEPRYDAFPPDAVYPAVNSAEDFVLEEGNEMFAVRVSLGAGDYRMDFYLSPMHYTATDVINGIASKDDYRWLVNAVSIWKDPDWGASRGWTPPAKPDQETAGTPGYWQAAYQQYYNVYPKEYERGDLLPQRSFYNLPSLLLQSGIYPQYREPGEEETAIPLDEYAELVEHYFGAENLEGFQKDNHIYRVDAQRRLVLLEDRSVRLRENVGIRLTGVELIDGSDQVLLTVHQFGEVDGVQVDQKIYQYQLVWDEAVGYVPVKIGWEFVETHQASVKGASVTFDRLWDLDLSQNWKVSFPVFKNRVYRFKAQGKALTYDLLDLGDLTQETDVLLREFDEEILEITARSDGLLVYAGDRVYRFDEALRIARSAWFPVGEGKYRVASDDLGQIAFSTDEGVFVSGAGANARPRLLIERPEAENVVMEQYYYPVQFLKDGNLLVGVSVWEASAGEYLIVNPAGKVVDRLPFFVSGEHSGGYFYYNEDGAAHFYDDRTVRYYNFEEKALTSLNLPGKTFSGYTDHVVPGLRQKHVWYLSNPVVDQLLVLPERTDFYAMDFPSGEIRKLPLSVTGAVASVLAAGENGDILFGYFYLGESGFGITREN